jgi:hypothetical protein
MQNIKSLVNPLYTQHSMCIDKCILASNRIL